MALAGFAIPVAGANAVATVRRYSGPVETYDLAEAGPTILHAASLQV